MTVAEVRQRHDQKIIKRRNDIAHRADRDAHGIRQPITAGDADSAVAWITDLVRNSPFSSASLTLHRNRLREPAQLV